MIRHCIYIIKSVIYITKNCSIGKIFEKKFYKTDVTFSVPQIDRSHLYSKDKITAINKKSIYSIVPN